MLWDIKEAKYLLQYVSDISFTVSVFGLSGPTNSLDATKPGIDSTGKCVGFAITMQDGKRFDCTTSNILGQRKCNALKGGNALINFSRHIGLSIYYFH